MEVIARVLPITSLRATLRASRHHYSRSLPLHGLSTVERMTGRRQNQKFVAFCRTRITLQPASLRVPDCGGRIPELRPEEVALSDQALRS